MHIIYEIDHIRQVLQYFVRIVCSWFSMIPLFTVVLKISICMYFYWSHRKHIISSGTACPELSSIRTSQGVRIKASTTRSTPSFCLNLQYQNYGNSPTCRRSALIALLMFHQFPSILFQVTTQTPLLGASNLFTVYHQLFAALLGQRQSIFYQLGQSQSIYCMDCAFWNNIKLSIAIQLPKVVTRRHFGIGVGNLWKLCLWSLWWVCIWISGFQVSTQLIILTLR